MGSQFGLPQFGFWGLRLSKGLRLAVWVCSLSLSLGFGDQVKGLSVGLGFTVRVWV